MFIRITLLLLAFLISACTNLKTPSNVNWSDHQASVLSADTWSLQGRLNIRNNQSSETITINWQQNKETFAINLSGRLGIGGVQITGDEDQVTINKGNEAPITANNIEELSLAYLGYAFPIQELFYWVRGVPTPKHEYQSEFNDQGLLQSLQQMDQNQQSWQIEYDRYQLSDGISLPGRIRVEQVPYRLTFNISRWQRL